MRLYRESLAIHEALGNLQGKSTTLSMMADLYSTQRDWATACMLQQQSLVIYQQLGDLSGIAFSTVKLGQLAQAEGDISAALANYREGLTTFERLNMPRESQQVRDMIAQAEAATQPTVPLDAAISAWIAKEQADEKTQALLALLDRIASAVVLACRAADAAGREHLAQQIIPLRVALGTWSVSAQLPPFRLFFGCLQALLRDQADLLTRQRQQLDQGLAAALAQVEHNIAADEATLRDEARARKIADLRRQVDAAMPQALRDEDQARRTGLITQLEQAAQAAEGEAPGSPWLALAAYLRGCVALLRGETVDAALLTDDDQAQFAAWARGEFAAETAPADPPSARPTVEQQCNAAAEQVVALTHAALADDDPAARAALVGQILDAAAHSAEGEQPGSPYDELARFLRAVAALLQGLPTDMVPPAYAERLNQLRQRSEEE